jgi:rubrerythrin
MMSEKQGMTELERLRHLLEHWIEHNNAHIRTYSEWARKAEGLGERELSNILKQIAEETKRLEDLFKKALEQI